MLLSNSKIEIFDVSDLFSDRSKNDFTMLLTHTGNRFGDLKPIESSSMSSGELQEYQMPRGSIFIGDCFILTLQGGLFLRSYKYTFTELFDKLKKVDALLEFVRQTIKCQDRAWRLVNMRFRNCCKPLNDCDRYSFFPEEFFDKLDDAVTPFGKDIPLSVVMKIDFIDLPRELAKLSVVKKNS